jgi:hypothetical protein
VSWLLVLAGAVAFGGGIVGLARVLPSDNRGQETATYAGGADSVRARVEAPTPAPTTVVGEPPAARVEASALPVTAFDFRPLDATSRDRFGNPPKRDAAPDELAAIASAHDVIVDDLRWQPDGAALASEQIAAMKAVNPRLRVLRYLGALTSNDGPIFNIAPDDGVHGSWFLRDGSGDFVRAYAEIAVWDRQPSYVLDPSSVDARNDIATWARQFARLGYDGVVLDGVTACVPAPASPCATSTLLSSPINKTTNRPYSDAEWLAHTTGLLQAIRHSAPNTQIFVPADGDQSPLLGYVDGLVVLSQ